MTQSEAKEILLSQLADDFCCTREELSGSENVFNPYTPREDRRKWGKDVPCFLKIACFENKLLFCGQPELISLYESEYKDESPEWFFEFGNMRKLDEKLRALGYRIGMAHPFYISCAASEVPFFDAEIGWYDEKEIEAFRGDSRFDEAFAFSEDAPDIIGVSASRGGKIIGMAGASRDSSRMYQIGINVDEGFRGEHIGSGLVTLLKNEILRRGVLPFYGTSMSHIASQRTALRAGFFPAWAELTVKKTGDE